MPDLSNGLIKSVVPGAAVDGGEVIITCESYDTSDYSTCKVLFDKQRGRLVSASASRVIAAAPEYGVGESGEELRLISATTDCAVPFKLGAKIAENLHPVANPAIDRDDGSIYVTLSGQRRYLEAAVEGILIGCLYLVITVDTITEKMTASSVALARKRMMTSVRIMRPIMDTPSRTPEAKATMAVRTRRPAGNRRVWRRPHTASGRSLPVPSPYRRPGVG